MPTDALGVKIQSYAYDAWGMPSGFDAGGVGISPAIFASRFLCIGRDQGRATA